MSVQQLQAMEAAQAEAVDTPHLVTVRGETFAFKRLKKWPAKAFRIFDQGHFDTALELALADRKADAERWLDEFEPTVEECEEVFDKIQQAEGLGPGESSASTSSSNGTGTR